MAGFWERLREGMSKTRGGLGDRVRSVFSGRQWNDGLYDELEEILYEADLGAEVVEEVLARLRDEVRRRRPERADDVLAVMQDVMVEMLVIPSSDPFALAKTPAIWLMVGVNGTGKTTTAGKFADRFRQTGRKVILGAGDTFRAAATEQLVVWGERAGVEVVQQAPGADPAAVAFDTVRAAVARHMDVAIIDTAGRLHNKSNLMQELQKVVRVIRRELAEAPHEVWLVIDATTGQNGLEQARVFQQAVEVTGVILTKLDGTAKGGIAFAIHQRLGVPIRFIGLGEQKEDLMAFEPEAYVKAILGIEARGL